MVLAGVIGLVGTTCRFDPIANVGEKNGHVCGNGLVEDGEECDGLNLARQTCDSLGVSGG